MKHLGSVYILISLFICGLLLSSDIWAQSGINVPPAQWLRNEAKTDREFADELSIRAKSWRALEQQARNNATQTGDPDFQQSWLKDAAYDDAQATELDHQIDDLKARANRKEKEASDLEQTVPDTQTTAIKATPRGQTLQESYRGQADLQRKQAQLLRDYAGRWRGAARHLQAGNVRSSQAVQASVAESVALYEQQAQALEDQAATADNAAQVFTKLANTTPPDRPELDDQKDPIASPDLFVGHWITKQQTGDQPESIRIRALNLNGSPPTLTLDSNRFHWIGLYDDTPTPPHGRIDFTMEPSAKAMNQDIPDWARSQVAADLVWHAEVNTVDICGPKQITVKWFPGEVTWDSSKKKAWVTGSGKPVMITYQYVPDPPEEAGGFASVSVVSASPSNGIYKPLRAIARGLFFRVQVLLPSFMGDDEGNEIRANINGVGGTYFNGSVKTYIKSKLKQAVFGSNGSFQVSLEGNKTPSGAWLYLSAPLRFTRIRGFDELAVQAVIESAISSLKQQPPSFGVLSKGAASNEIEFATTDGEILQVSVPYGGGVSKPLLVFDNPTSFSKFEIRRALDDYEIGFRTAVLGAGDDSATVEDRLALITNARAFLNYKPATTEVWPDYLSSEIGLIYLKLLKGPDSDVAVNPTIEGENAEGISYRSTKEKDAIEATITAVKHARISTYLSDLKKGLKGGIDSKAVVAQFSYFDPEDVTMAVLGEDWSGARVERTDKWLARTRMGLQLFADLAGLYSITRAVEETAGNSIRQAAREEVLGATEDEIPTIAKELDTTPVLDGPADPSPGKPGAMKPTIVADELLPEPGEAASPNRLSPANAATQRAIDAGKKKLASTKPGSKSDVPVNDPHGTFPRPVEPPANYEADAIDRFAKRSGLRPDQFEALNPDSTLNLNHATGPGSYCRRSGCTLASIAYLLEKFKVGTVSADSIFTYLVDTFGLNITLARGANLNVVKDIMERLYGAVSHNIRTLYTGATFEFIEDGIKRGSQFVTGIRYAGTAGEAHAVVITNYERLAGKELITFYDINAHAEIRMSCDLFRDKLLLRLHDAGTPQAHSFIYEVSFKR